MAEHHKLIRIAVDAPLGPLRSPRNYGALQLASLGALPPRSPLSVPLPNVSVKGGCDISIEDNGYTYILSPKASGNFSLRDISGADYLNGLNYLANHDLIVRHLILRNANLALTRDGSAIIRFQNKVPAFEGLLSSPAWIPFRTDKWPGARQISEIAPNRWEAFCPYNTLPTILVEVVRNPEENITLYEKGIINQTADTATPFNSSTANGLRIIKKTSLRGILVFSGELIESDKKSLRKEIRDILKEINCAEHVGWAKASAPSDDPLPLKNLVHQDWSPIASRSGLTLAFSDYYPNAIVAWSIATILHKNGIPCTPVSDSYSNPKVKASMRLMIVSGPTNDAWGRYASLILCPAWRNAPHLQKLYIDILNSPIFSNAHQQLLDDLLDDLCPSVTIGAIPSICLSNINHKN